nr:Sodium/hydrogen exchanger family [uncultured bacterium]
MSLALGAFVAGMLISETPFKYQVEEDIKPFRDVLLGLFFITIGMLLDVNMVIHHWWVVLALLAAIVLFKFAIIASLAKLFGAPDGTAIRTGLALAQAGEFGFVLLNEITGARLIEPAVLQPVLAAMVLSMLLAPLIITKSDEIVMKVSANEWMNRSLQLTQIATRTMSAQKHVILAGFGRTGQSLATLLSEENIGYQALDLDPERVAEAQSAGANVSYGDAARREALVAAGVHRAAAMVITYASTPSALKVLRLVRELAPTLPVIVRSHDDSDLERLKAEGAAEVVPELLEGSLMLASHALVMLGVPLRRVVHRVQAARDERYSSLRGYFAGSSDTAEEDLFVRLHSVTLPEGASSVGLRVDQLGLEELATEVTAIRRGSQRIAVTPETQLQAGDVVVLRGAAEAVSYAEYQLLR